MCLPVCLSVCLSDYCVGMYLSISLCISVWLLTVRQRPHDAGMNQGPADYANVLLQATVKEALMFSARPRLDSSVSDSQVKQYVDEVIGIVELLPIQNKMVGMPKVSGLSVEQRKRLTIAVELVANPSVVFMDEPTSGQ